MKNQSKCAQWENIKTMKSNCQESDEKVRKTICVSKIISGNWSTQRPNINQTPNNSTANWFDSTTLKSP